MIKNPVTLITGTSRGIGKELAEYYLSHKHIVIGCSRGHKTIDQTNYTHFQIDITDEKAVITMFRYIKQTYGKLDNLINNASISNTSLGLLTSTYTFENILKVNTTGTFICIREAAKVMIKNHYGRIINFTSGSVPINLDGTIPYTASKAAIEMMTKAFAQELAPYGITVNAIGPGMIDTTMLNKYMTKEKYEQLLKYNFIINENTTINDIINIIDFFIKKESYHITAQVIYACGPK